jgi:hypothetical protein
MRKYLEDGAVKALSVSREQSECHRPTSMRLRLLAASLIEDDPDHEQAGNSPGPPRRCPERLPEVEGKLR